MRRSAGSFVRGKLIQLSMFGAVGVGVVFGLVLGAVLFSVSGWIGYVGVYVAFGVAVVVVLLGVVMLMNSRLKWNLNKLGKGVDAEKKVGQALEYALISKGCAVAHSVRSIAKYGDIDHVVATPNGIWVIETKYSKVPKGEFSKALSVIAKNTREVREWAPTGVLVRGCLVIAYEDPGVRESYQSGKETIMAFRPDRLIEVLRSEVARKEVVDHGVVSEIWKLGDVSE